MARINICGFETGDIREGYTGASGASSSGSISGAPYARTGSYGLKIGQGSFNGEVAIAHDAAGRVTTAAKKLWIRFYAKLISAGIDENTPVTVYNTNFPTAVIVFNIRQTGNIIVGATTYSGVLSTTDWNRVEFSITYATPTAYELKVDGTVIGTGTGESITLAPFQRLSFGNGISGGPLWAIDDVTIDDAEYPGPGAIVRLDPNGNGTNTDWTNDYQAVDDYNSQAGDDGDSTTIYTSTLDAGERATLEDATGIIPSDDSLKTLKPLVVARRGSNATKMSLLFMVDSGPQSTSYVADLAGTDFLADNTYELRAFPYVLIPPTITAVNNCAIMVYHKQSQSRRLDCTVMALMVEYTPLSSSIKDIEGNTYANTKTVQGLAIANMKNLEGLAEYPLEEVARIDGRSRRILDRLLRKAA